jgi:hypothetical protein
MIRIQIESIRTPPFCFLYQVLTRPAILSSHLLVPLKQVQFFYVRIPKSSSSNCFLLFYIIRVGYPVVTEPPAAHSPFLVSTSSHCRWKCKLSICNKYHLRLPYYTHNILDKQDRVSYTFQHLKQILVKFVCRVLRKSTGIQGAQK